MTSKIYFEKTNFIKLLSLCSLCQHLHPFFQPVFLGDKFVYLQSSRKQNKYRVTYCRNLFWTPLQGSTIERFRLRCRLIRVRIRMVLTQTSCQCLNLPKVHRFYLLFFQMFFQPFYGRAEQRRRVDLVII